MEGMTLKSRAVAFAFCVGAVAFILALFAGAGMGASGADLAQAIIIAIICGAMSWASAERAVSGHADAVDAAIERLSLAAEGDLVSPTPPRVTAVLPDLGGAMDGLMAQVRANLDTVHHLAMFDPVTRLANRVHFRREAGRMLREAGETPCALFFIDLDKFKAVNDSFGHAQGDLLLGKVANRLRAVVAPEEGQPPRFATPPLIGRLAGDEFTLFAPGVGERDEAEKIGRALLFALTEPFDLAGQPVEIGASIGVAISPAQGRTLSELMRAADAAMYHAKERGRGQVQSFTPMLAERLADNSRLERELRDALGRGEFTFVFQPQLALASGRIAAVEALMRWHHPVDGLRAPGSFIPRAEESGIIHELGDWALEEFARRLAHWQRIGQQLGPQHGGIGRLAVNVSPRQIVRPDFFTRLRDALVRHDAPPALLELEITESMAMQCGDETLAELARLRAEGVTIAIDDFGTGYSNFARLKDLPIDRVKIDRSLTADIDRCAAARTIAQAVTGLVHGLGHEVVAEGVETAEQLAILRVIGCDLVQGYAIARPMPEQDFLDWMRGHALSHQPVSGALPG
ncbi:EAL domain-containing protein [Sphingomonas changnyeongensis]|uniref:EAL domain-containing protein n=1 Tax=Sphingomonas changnyeongensis TaxID=2698679 RepID=A0A7Z2NXA3_9SPHN|nr:bifunctional diguanylate cyclase/phosphodiesterase [Sphingomonas changnyeongensis]QHL91490.1 EAL domain-containing protein [Sphingomonas changnyeongensis]